MSSPPDGARKIARVLKRGRASAIYLYEDFATRARGWRLLLWTVNQARHVTTRLPPALLHALCWLASPITWLLFTVSACALRRLPGLRSVATSFPCRHGTDPWSLAGDLFDRFSASVERRFAESSTRALLEEAGLIDIRSAYEQGWMVVGTRPQ